MKQKKQSARAYRDIEVVGNTIKIKDPALAYRLEKVAKQRGETMQAAFEATAEKYLATH